MMTGKIKNNNRVGVEYWQESVGCGEPSLKLLQFVDEIEIDFHLQVRRINHPGLASQICRES